MIGDDIGLGALVALRIRFEGDRAGENPPVQFRQHNIHGQVTGVQSLRILGPCISGGAGEHHLKHGAVGA